jgi:choline dehydrogenase-like flavoprotein
VVDKNCKAHDFSNLYIVDSSIFVTSAGVNPSNTIQALALRAGDAIAKRFSGDNVENQVDNIVI